MLIPWKESYDQPRQHIKKQRHYFVNKGLYSQTYGFSSSHHLVHNEGWALKNWCFWTVGLEKTLETARRSNQSILREISPEYSLEDFEIFFLTEGEMLLNETDGSALNKQEPLSWEPGLHWPRIFPGNLEVRGGWSLSKKQDVLGNFKFLAD